MNVKSHQKPQSKALNCKKCQDCCDDFGSDAWKAVSKGFDVLKYRLEQLYADPGIALALAGGVGLRVLSINFTPLVGSPNWMPGMPIEVDPYFDDFISSAQERGLSVERNRGLNTDIGIVTIRSRTDATNLIQAAFDGARNGLARTIRKQRDQCKDCCLRKAFRQDKPQIEVTETVMKRM